MRFVGNSATLALCLDNGVFCLCNFARIVAGIFALYVAQSLPTIRYWAIGISSVVCIPQFWH
jgi:hypothetical protein